MARSPRTRCGSWASGSRSCTRSPARRATRRLSRRSTTCASRRSGCATCSRPPRPRSGPPRQTARSKRRSSRTSLARSTTATSSRRACARTSPSCERRTRTRCARPPRRTARTSTRPPPGTRRTARATADSRRCTPTSSRAATFSTRHSFASGSGWRTTDSGRDCWTGCGGLRSNSETDMSDITREIATHEAPADEREDAPPMPLDSRELYFNRELSWLDFNDRVLQLTDHEHMRLLERVKFLSIYTTNLDEFFMVRVAGHHDQVDAGIEGRGPDGLTAQQTIDSIAERVRELDGRHSHQWEAVVRPALAENGIRVVNCENCNAEELRAADRHFHDQIFPALTPLAVGPGRPFPYISNLSLSLAVWVRDPESEAETFARVKVPKEVLPRLIEIGKGTFIPLESIIARNLDALFPGMEVVTHDFFRVTRDADFTVSGEADDLLRAAESARRALRFGEVVRLEVGAGMDERLRSRLIDWLAVEQRQGYDGRGGVGRVEPSGF